MPSMFSQVEKFNKEILGIAPRKKGLQPIEEARLSRTQLVEEANEFIDAVESQDYIGAVDACMDSIVFAMGILYKLGVRESQFDDIGEVIMAANMSKKIGVKAGREGFDAADAVKPKGWVPPEETIALILGDEE